MESRAKAMGHPIHPMLVAFPLGLFPVSLIFDLVSWYQGGNYFTLLAYWMIEAGVIGALAAAIFGTIDWLAIPSRTRAKRLGLLHGVTNLVVVAHFILSWNLRRDAPGSLHLAAIGASALGNLLLLAAAWMGGELVYRLGVGLDEGANLNAPNSLSHKSLRSVREATTEERSHH